MIEKAAFKMIMSKLATEIDSSCDESLGQEMDEDVKKCVCKPDYFIFKEIPLICRLICP